MDEKGTSMTDAGPLVKIKQSLTRLKSECTQMEVRIGVVSASAYKLASNPGFPSPRQKVQRELTHINSLGMEPGDEATYKYHVSYLYTMQLITCTWLCV